MKLAAMVILSMMLVSGVAVAADPQIGIVNGKVSISADAVPLGLLLSLLDKATGLQSEVMAPELANRRISVRFTGLELKHAVRKIFEGQPVNYMFIEGKGLRVTEASQSGPSAFPSIAANPPSLPPSVQPSGPSVSAKPPAALGVQATPARPPANAASASPNNAALGNPGSSSRPIPGQIAPPAGIANTNSFGSTGDLSAPATVPAGAVSLPAAPGSKPVGPGSIPPALGSTPAATVTPTPAPVSAPAGPISMPTGPKPGTPGYKLQQQRGAGPGTVSGPGQTAK